MENEEINENVEMVVGESNILSVADLKEKSDTKMTMVTTITDKKKLFNLENAVDNLINDCVGEKIRVKDVIIKEYIKPLKEPVVDEQTGEIIRDIERKMSCVLVDDNGVSYATGSKTFILQLQRFFTNYGTEELKKDGLEIEIIKKNISGSNNKALSFKLV